MATSAQNPPATILEYSSEKWKSKKIDHLVPQSLPETCYVFLDSNSYPQRDGDHRASYQRESDRKDLLQYFDVPNFLYNDTCTELNGYFGCKGIRNKEEKLESYSTWFRCLVKMVRKEPKGSRDEEPEYVPKNSKKDYMWFEMGFFTRWERPDRCRVLCIDTPEKLQSRLETVLREQSPLKFSDPFAMHVPLIDQIILLYDVSVWRVRDPVRKIEKDREREKGLNTEAHFKEMHENSRHATHVSEVLSVTIETIEGIQRQQKAIHGSLSSDLGKSYQEQAQEYLSFQLQMVKSLKLRSVSNHKRLKDEIRLAHDKIIEDDNKIAQADSKVAQEDNRVVKSITLLTMIFLPATFISAFFSTTFFTLSEDGWKASNRLWIYWTITIPSTLLVLVIWYFWLYRQADFPLWKKFFGLDNSAGQKTSAESTPAGSTPAGTTPVGSAPAGTTPAGPTPAEPKSPAGPTLVKPEDVV